ncbi:SET domain-containing protein SmydA-8 isoform X1 [Diabrotica undecimpunctata]|uniref:SET domain-containing protein SmydA-8 isoform X1 n=1 Tax=Diabrotica undecimpunctata TaxID=50387 RepID=UPI003B6367F1
MSEENKCQVCQKPADQRCGGCHSVHYCCKEHQKNDWKQHKKHCKPFKVCTDDVLGRHLKATKDLKPGDVIIQENPLIWGPAISTVPVCLGCGQEVNQRNSRPCSKCGWPMCSDLCEKAPAHIPECRYTFLRGDKVSIKNFGITHPNYQCITVLRILYQKQFLPEVWKKIEVLQSHDKERKGTQSYEHERTQIAQFILKFFKLAGTFTEEEIMEVCGIIMVNSHEVPLTDPNHIAIYEQASMLEHSCSANCSKSFSNKGGLVITAGTHIKRGDHLSICYTDPLWGTPNRRHHLYNSKFFWCSCERCKDPEEFGTYFSALRCQDSNCKGYVIPKTFIDNSTNDKGSDWYCTTCPSKLSSYSVQDLLERIGKDLNDMPKQNIKECRSFIETYEELLHPNHFLLTDVKLALLNLIGQTKEGMREISDDELQLKFRLGQSLLNLFKQLVPGEKRVRGVCLFELIAALAEIARRKTEPDIVYASMLESKSLLTQCIELLKHEPDALPEGKMCQQARNNLKELELVLQRLHKTLGNELA